MDALKARLGHGDNLLLTQVELCHALDASWSWVNRRKALHNAVCRVNACFVPKALQDRCACFHLHHPSVCISSGGGRPCLLAWRIVTGLLGAGAFHLISSFGLEKLVWDFCEFCVLAKIYMDFGSYFGRNFLRLLAENFGGFWPKFSRLLADIFGGYFGLNFRKWRPTVQIYIILTKYSKLLRAERDFFMYKPSKQVISR